MSYVLVGLALGPELKDYDGGLTVLRAFNPPLSTDSSDLADRAIPDDAPTFETLDAAGEVHDRLALMDEHYVPAFHPVVAETDDGQLTVLWLPPGEGGDDTNEPMVRKAAERYGVEVRQAQ